MSTPKQYRRKPVVIEAWVFTSEAEGRAIAAWCGGRFNYDPSPRDHTDVHISITIPTLEGNMTAQRGDYIIRGLAGEFYPCKPDIFAATYEEVSE